MPDDADLSALAEYIDRESDAHATSIVAHRGLDPSRWVGPIKEAQAADDTLEALREHAPGEPAGGESEPTTDADHAVERDLWADADFRNPETGVYPPALHERESWMGLQLAGEENRKQPFAPWADADAPAPCSRCDDGVTAETCEHDARYKWGHAGNYVDGDTMDMVADDPKLDGRVFIQQESDPFAFVDGDDVRDPETGKIHPGFVAVLERFGLTYADVSVSGSGAHANYRGDLPEGVKQAVIQLDDEPWGANDDVPAVEIYPGKHVCVTTGAHVPGSADDVRPWDESEVADLLDEHDLLPDPDAGESDDLSDYEPPEDLDETDETDDSKAVATAVDRLDARRVADETIVAEWNDDASTSGGHRAFVPTWATGSCRGTANVVNENRWLDTGGNGYGGPAVMAAIDAGLVDESAQPSDVSGQTWADAVRHLADLGFNVPKLTDSDETQSPRGDDSQEPGTSDARTSNDGWDSVYRMYRGAEEQDEKLTARFEGSELLRNDRDWATIRESDSLYAYDPDDGIYRPHGERDVREDVAEGLREQFTVHEYNEMCARIRALTQVDADDMGGPTRMIPCGNGVYNLKTGELEPHDPDHYFTARVETHYDAGAECPLWRAFLKDVVNLERDRKKLQEFVGYTLLHDELPFHKSLFIAGPQASGKSTFLDTVRALYSDETVTSLTPQQITGGRFNGAELFDSWVNVRSDIPKETVENTGMFKEVIAGDKVQAERKYQDPFFFEPTTKHLYSANILPSAEVDDEAFFRRILLVAFPETVPESDRDPYLEDKLREELPGIFNWALEGAERLLEQGGFTGDLSVGRTEETWAKWGEPVKQFKRACLKEIPDDKALPKDEVYQAFTQYCKSENIPSSTRNNMTRQLKKEGVVDDRVYIDGSRTRAFLGVEFTDRGKEVFRNATSSDDESGESGLATGLDGFGDDD